MNRLAPADQRQRTDAERIKTCYRDQQLPVASQAIDQR
jgi:hypothetical protein